MELRIIKHFYRAINLSRTFFSHIKSAQLLRFEGKYDMVSIFVDCKDYIIRVILNVVFSPQIISLLDGKNFASLGTVMPSGFPQVTPVWIDYDENHDLLVNTALGRAKERNTTVNDKVGLSIFSMSNPYETVSIIGNVIDKTSDRDNHHFNKLSRKYLNLDKYPIDKSEEKRVILKIRPKKVFYVSIPLSSYI